MSVGWNAGSVRARALAAQRAGRSVGQQVAARSSLDAALAELAGTMYGPVVRPGQDLESAQRAVTARIVWLLRVLAGWYPREGAAVLRLLLGPVEIANVADLLQRLSGSPSPPPVALGRLGTSWSRLAAATSLSELRDVLRTTPWGDPGGDQARDVVVGMQLSLADRVIAAVPGAGAWASGAAALLVARQLVTDEPAHATAETSRVLGTAVLGARSPADVARLSTPEARWVFAGVGDAMSAQDLWRAECGWWARVEHDAGRLARHRAPGPEVLVGSVGLLAADGRRVRAALEVAARGGGSFEDDDVRA